MRSKRRAVTILEVMISAAMLSALLGVCWQLTAAVGAANRAAAERQTAICEAANLMETIATLPWDELTARRVGRLQLSEEAQLRLPGGELEIELTGPAGSPPAKRIVVSIRWQDRSDQLTRPVRLATWRYHGR